jgi:hypothetical protein
VGALLVVGALVALPAGARADETVTSTDTPSILFDQTAGAHPAYQWSLSGNDGSFFLSDATGGGTLPFRIAAGAPHGSLYVDPDGGVGIGTAPGQLFSTPASLNVQRSDGTASLLVSEQSTTPAARTLGTLSNDGPAGLKFTDTNASSSWVIGNGDGKRFSIAAADGSAPTALSVTPTGDTLANGAISQRVPKATVQKVATPDPNNVAFGIAHLPISTYRYPGDPDAAVHLGPTAEDFAAAFHLGASTSAVSPTDMAGVALAGVKALANTPTSVPALTARATADEKRIKALETDNKKLKKTTSSLSKSVSSLKKQVKALAKKRH